MAYKDCARGVRGAATWMQGSVVLLFRAAGYRCVRGYGKHLHYHSYPCPSYIKAWPWLHPIYVLAVAHIGPLAVRHIGTGYSPASSTSQSDPESSLGQSVAYFFRMRGVHGFVFQESWVFPHDFLFGVPCEFRKGLRVGYGWGLGDGMALDHGWGWDYTTERWD